MNASEFVQRRDGYSKVCKQCLTTISQQASEKGSARAGNKEKGKDGSLVKGDSGECRIINDVHRQKKGTNAVYTGFEYTRSITKSVFEVH